MSIRIEDLSPEDRRLLRERLADPIWRISNLYSIVDKSATVVPFRPNLPQQEILDDIYVKKLRRIAILKARRMGFSTLIELITFDMSYWGENIQASIVDLTQQDASEKLTKKCKFFYESMPLDLREPLKVDNSKELGFQNGSNINAGKNARGGTNHILHISEWGPIAHEDPARSEEIKTGALPSADQGVVLIESTFKGGKGGAFYDVLKRAQETPVQLKTAKDFHFRFFGWYRDPTCSLQGDMARITKETHRYLDEKEKELGIKFTDGQRLFYQVTKEEQGIFMFREYPTTPEEAFRAPVEGSVYGDAVSAARANGRIIPYEWDRGCPVFSTWDIGWNDSTSVWLVQLVGRELSWIWHTRKQGRTAAEMVAELRATGIPIAAHFLPHDAGSKSPGQGKNYRDHLEEAGLVNIKVVPRCTSIWPGIDALRKRIHQSWFRKGHVDEGVDALEAYHVKQAGANGNITEEPVHDWSSHDSSAARIFAEAMELGMVNTLSAQRIHRQEMRPLAPDGSMVILEHVQEIRRGGRQATAMAGGIKL